MHQDYKVFDVHLWSRLALHFQELQCEIVLVIVVSGYYDRTLERIDDALRALEPGAPRGQLLVDDRPKHCEFFDNGILGKRFRSVSNALYIMEVAPAAALSLLA